MPNLCLAVGGSRSFSLYRILSRSQQVLKYAINIKLISPLLIILKLIRRILTQHFIAFLRVCSLTRPETVERSDSYFKNDVWVLTPGVFLEK